MICNLCLEEKKLIKVSHIISDFLHSELYDEKHKLIKFHPKDLRESKTKFKSIPSATYEGGILCNKCDNEIIGKYETYISNVLKGNLEGEKKVFCKEIVKFEDVKIVEVKNLNFQKTKLFLLSILWRSHISSRPEFIHINLGSYAERIRIQLLNGIATKDDDIEITILKFDRDANLSNFIGSPVKHSTENKDYYSIIIMGYLILYHLSETKLSRDLKTYRLKESGKLEIWEFPKDIVGKFVMGYTGVAKNIKL